MRAFLFAAALTLSACTPAEGTGAPPAPAPIDAEQGERVREDLQRLDEQLRADGVFEAGIGETADLGGGLTVRPIDVVEDSRCPLDVDCAWAGRLVLRAAVSGVAGEGQITLEEPFATPNGTVVLVLVSPSPSSSWPEEMGPIPAYRFGFRRA